MNPSIDLNCDMGESYGAWVMGNDAAVLRYVSSANIACGFHGGDPATMRKTVAAALAQGVALGAHPGLQDLSGFGRRVIPTSPQGSLRPGGLPARRAGGRGRLTGRAPAPREGARRAVQHGGQDEGLSRAICQAVRTWTARWCCTGWRAAGW